MCVNRSERSRYIRSLQLTHFDSVHINRGNVRQTECGSQYSAMQNRKIRVSVIDFASKCIFAK